MRKRAVAHLKGDIWYWTAGFGAAGVLAAMLERRTVAAFLLMITGILMIMADSHVDPLALITEDALRPDEVAGSLPVTGRGCDLSLARPAPRRPLVGEPFHAGRDVHWLDGGEGEAVVLAVSRFGRG
jgi:hypothetical protein